MIDEPIRIRGSEIGKTGPGAKAMWLKRTCPDCGTEDYVRCRMLYEDRARSHQRCGPCNLQKEKTKSWRRAHP
jgi:transcription elongation factor Elf1